MKTCSLCGLEKLAAEFYKRRASPDGLAYRCKVCSTEAGKQWHAEHRSEANARRRARRDGNLEEERARCSAWKQANLEYKRALDRQHYKQNADKIKVNVQAWKREHRPRINAQSRELYQKDIERHRALARAQSHRRRSQLNEPFDGDCRDYETVLIADPCCYCGAESEHIDHIEAVASGGRNHWTNLTAACGHCNRSKSKRPLLKALLALNQ